MLVAALAVSSLCFAPRSVLAQEAASPDSEARAQYQQGTQNFQAKRYSEAALHFESAATIRVSAVALYTAGLAWDLASKPERAADAYARALDLNGLDAKQTNTARDRIDKLERTLGSLNVTAPDGWRVQLDAFTEVLAPARLHASAGPHTLSVKAPGKPLERSDVALESGKTTPMKLEEKVETMLASSDRIVEKTETNPLLPRPAMRTFWITRRVVGMGLAGVGVGGLGAAFVLGTEANGAKDAYNAGPTRSGFDHASSMQTWTNAALVAGGALLVGGIVLVAIPASNDGRVEVGLGPTGASLKGTF